MCVQWHRKIDTLKSNKHESIDVALLVIAVLIAPCYTLWCHFGCLLHCATHTANVTTINKFIATILYSTYKQYWLDCEFVAALDLSSPVNVSIRCSFACFGHFLSLLLFILRNFYCLCVAFCSFCLLATFSLFSFLCWWSEFVCLVCPLGPTN